MDVSLKTLFNSQDLPGEFLVIPLKVYHQFFAEKLHASSGLAKVAWIVGNIATGVFAYPIFGILAVIGMIIKPRGIEALRNHNQEQMTALEAEHVGLKVALGIHQIGNRSTANEKRHVFKEFKITKENAETQFAAAAEAIRDCSRRLMKIHVASEGKIDVKNNTGQISVKLMTDSPVSRFWIEEQQPSLELEPASRNSARSSAAQSPDMQLVPADSNRSDAKSVEAPHALTVVHSSNPPANQEGGWLSSIGNWFSKAVVPKAPDPAQVNAILDRAMGEVLAGLTQQTIYPNKTLVAVRIEGKGAPQPFLGAMNLNYVERPGRFVWNASLHREMREYITKYSVLKFEFGLCIVTEGRISSKGEKLCNLQVLDKQMALEQTGTSSKWRTMTCKDMNFEGFKHMFETMYPVFQVIANRAEDVFGAM